MCLVQRLEQNQGAAGSAIDLQDAQLNELLRRVREDPAVPLALRANTTSHYRYQNPGTSDDTAEGKLFNVKRDLTILRLMGLVPGVVLPAIDVFIRLFDKIKSANGVCWSDETTSEIWRGCDAAAECAYDRGIARGIGLVFPPRPKAEMDAVKRSSARETAEADALCIRPHHLLCITCAYGRTGNLDPIAADNIFEVLDAMARNPMIPVTLVQGCCMVCPSCAAYQPDTGLCIGSSLGSIGIGLRDELKDLTVLEALGLEYGAVLPARDLFRELFGKVRSTNQICGWGDGVSRSPEWKVCGTPDPESREVFEGEEQFFTGRDGIRKLLGLD